MFLIKKREKFLAFRSFFSSFAFYDVARWKFIINYAVN